MTLGLLLACSTFASAEILALLNYESKPNQLVRREGIAIMDIDPESGNFGKILMEIPLPPDLVAHHIFFNRDRSKAYITALGKSILHVVNLRTFPYRLQAIDVPDCQMGEDLAVSEDNRTWYLTCMGSDNVIMGDALLDKPIKTVSAAEPVPGDDSVSARHCDSQRHRSRPCDQYRQAGYVRCGRIHHRDRGRQRQGALDPQGLIETVSGKSRSR